MVADSISVVTAGNYDDRRVARTRATVLSYAQELLAKDGAAALSYSTLAAATGLSRPTLYRHWPHITDLLHDLIPEGPSASLSSLSGDVRQRLVEFLCQVRDDLDDMRSASTLLSLVPQAERDVASQNKLRWAMDSQARALAVGLEGTGVVVSEIDLTLLVGPVFFRRFVHRAPVPDAFIYLVVDRFLGTRMAVAPTGPVETGLAW